MNQVNQLILYVSRTIPFRSGLDGYLIRGAMVFTFFAFSIQKWSQYTAEMLVPLISHSLATRFPDEGRPVPRRVILSAQAGSDARGAGDNTELSDPTIQTVRSTEL